MSGGLSQPAGDELLAAELALGLLSGDERASAEARLSADAGFAAAYHRWCGWAAGLADGLAEEAPRPSLWAEIVARLGPAGQAPASPQASGPAPAGQPANDNPADAARRLRRWQAAAVGTGLVAASLLAVMLAGPWPASLPRPTPVAAPLSAPMVAVLTGKAGVVTISFDPASGRMTSAASGVQPGARAAELWVIPQDGKPRSLGVMAADRPGWHPAPAAAAQVMRAGVTLAVSLEPQGGSPSGQPTGPVILSGRLVSAG